MAGERVSVQRPGFFRNFIQLAGPYWSSERKWWVRGLTLALVILTICQVMIPVALNIWSEHLFNALEQRAMDEFTTLLVILVAIIAANVVVVTTHLRVKRRLQVDWRRWLTHRLLGDWMADGRHYLVTHMPGEHDNPDGRIAEDIRISSELAIDLSHSLFYCILLLISFTQILWRLSGEPWVEVFGVQLYMPGHLVWIAVVYAAVGTTVALLLGQPLVKAANNRQSQEANFRFGLVHARESGLAIALVHGEGDERRRLGGLFGAAARAFDRQTEALAHLYYFASAWSVLSQVFPVLVAAPRYIGGSISLGVLMQTAQGFQQMIAALSWPIDNIAKVADWRASVERVLALDGAVMALAGAQARPGQAITVMPDGPALTFRDLAVANPDGSLAIHPFNATVTAGGRVLLTGDPAAAVKLFKVVAGLWPWGSGTVMLPQQGAIFFMPQKPHLPIGTLRDALMYPAADAAAFSDEALTTALHKTGLEHLASCLDQHENWEQSLAMGEQQRLGFARLLLHRPDWVFVQEATDGLDPGGETEMLRLLNTELPCATVITIGHHAGLGAFHQRTITLVPRDGAVAVEDGMRVPAGV